jgi:sterol desaturase/sphingolipid hydroxylase (fatty acid hydroxylase superfamily)
MLRELNDNTALYKILSWASWPALIIVCVSIMAYGFTVDQPIIFFNIAYLFLIVSLFALETVMPFEKQWTKPDGQNFANIAHTLSSKGTVQLILVFSAVISLAEVIKPAAEPLNYGIWPRDWPMWLQVILGLYVAEFMLYWAHRLGHEVPFFWRFHAVHHSVKKLWIINTGRFHFVDSLLSIVLGMAILLAFGAPLEVIQWMSAMTAFIGMLTHCNVTMKFGAISYVFNTPELHRWHHSMDLREGNRNYCENVMLWDQVFGTFINPKDRRPPANIGMKDYMPPKFWQQLLWPFLTNAVKKRIIPEFEPLPFIHEDKTTKSSAARKLSSQ